MMQNGNQQNYFVKKELSKWATKRVGQILRVMNRMGFVDQETYKEALAEKLWGSAGEIAQETAQSDVPSEDPEGEMPSLLSPPIEKLKAKALKQEQKIAAEPTAEKNSASEEQTAAEEAPKTIESPEIAKKPEVELKLDQSEDLPLTEESPPQ